MPLVGMGAVYFILQSPIGAVKAQIERQSKNEEKEKSGKYAFSGSVHALSWIAGFIEFPLLWTQLDRDPTRRLFSGESVFFVYCVLRLGAREDGQFFLYISLNSLMLRAMGN